MYKSILEPVKLFVLLALALVAGVTAAQNRPPSMADIWRDIEPVEFTDEDFQGVLNVFSDFEKEGVEIDVPEGDGPFDRDASLAAVRSNPKAMAILNRHGYTPEEFQVITMNVMAAFGASQMDQHQLEMAAAMEQLEALKGQLPAGQYERMRSQVLGMNAAFARVPPRNVQLAKKYEAEFLAIGEQQSQSMGR